MTKKEGVEYSVIEAKKVTSENEAMKVNIRSSAAAQAAEDRANALKTLAEVEGEHGESLVKLRKHKERMQRCRSETTMVRNGRIVVQGD